MRWIIVLAAMVVATAGESHACDATCQAQATAALTASQAEFDSVPGDLPNWETYFAAGLDYMEDAWAAGLDGTASDELEQCYALAEIGLDWGYHHYWRWASLCLDSAIEEIGQ